MVAANSLLYLLLAAGLSGKPEETHDVQRYEPLNGIDLGILCPPREHLSECEAHCQKNCTNYNKLIPCPRICVKGCVCDAGYVRGANGKCVLPKQCPVSDTCPRGEHYVQCNAHCQWNCTNYGKPISCPRICVHGCVCNEGTVRGPNRRCIEPSACPKKSSSEVQDEPISDSGSFCPINEKYSSCLAHCQRDCNNWDDETFSCSKSCSSGCICERDMIRGPDGDCIRPKQCPPKMNDDSLAGYPALAEPIPSMFKNVCIADLGCFWTGPPFYHPIHRPSWNTPIHTTGTRFLLYSPSTDRHQPYLLNLTRESVEESPFMMGVDTKILIHGYVVQLVEGDIRFNMTNEFLEAGAFNVIVVDWGAHNKKPYAQAFANARVVAAQVAKLITLLMAHKDLSPENVHLIGHSLGGQLCGWVGERVPNVGRITGLDPAGPYFQKACKEVRLDPTDADFVDIIHTNGGGRPSEGLGISETIGHMDFYPNGGQQQPGCFSNWDLMRMKKNYTIENLVANSCDHARANLFFLESIQTCSFNATQCDSYADFLNGDCKEGAVVEMGLRNRKLDGMEVGTKFFLKTNNKSPFCFEDSEE